MIKYVFKDMEEPTLYLDFEEDNMNEGMDAISFVDRPATDVQWKIFETIEDSYNDYPLIASENACRALKYKEKHPEIDCGQLLAWLHLRDINKIKMFLMIKDVVELCGMLGVEMLVLNGLSVKWRESTMNYVWQVLRNKNLVILMKKNEW